MMSRNELSPKQRRFVSALLESRTLKEAAERAGISLATAKRYKRDPRVQQELAERSQELVDALARRLRELGHQAVEVLEQAMAGGDGWAVRVRAADITLGRLLQVAELVELEARVTALEEQVLRKERQP